MRPVHFEIPAENTERAMKFFGDVFGWNFQEYGNGYFMAMTGEGMGINGAIYQRQKDTDGVVNSVGVPSVDEFVAKIEEAGGTVVMEKTEIGEHGWYAMFKDTEGNVHGLWQSNVVAGNEAEGGMEGDETEGDEGEEIDSEEMDSDDTATDETDEDEGEEMDSQDMVAKETDEDESDSDDVVSEDDDTDEDDTEEDMEEMVSEEKE